MRPDLKLQNKVSERNATLKVRIRWEEEEGEWCFLGFGFTDTSLVWGEKREDDGSSIGWMWWLTDGQVGLTCVSWSTPLSAALRTLDTRLEAKNTCSTKCTEYDVCDKAGDLSCIPRAQGTVILLNQPCRLQTNMHCAGLERG